MKRTVEELTPHRTESSTIHDPYVAPTPGAGAGAESALAEVLADVVHVERVPVDSNFFTDLGADSMVMAQFCARVRKRADLPAVSMKDIYQHPTIRSLAAALGPATPLTASTDAATAPVEVTLGEVLADLLHVERVPVDSHFFDDLGADSMLMARSAPGCASGPTCRRCR